MQVALFVSAGLVLLAVALVLARAFSRDAKGRALALERTATYRAAIRDIIHMRGWPNHTKLFLSIESPDGPIGEYLIVPLTPLYSRQFFQDMRATDRPILVRCCIDRSIDYALRQYAAVVGVAEP